MTKDHPMLENILSLVKPETWQSSIGLAEFTTNQWLDKIQYPDLERVYLVGCGSSLYNGQVGKYAMEQIAGLPAEAIPAFTFSRYIDPKMLNLKTLVIGISTTGGTLAVIEALEHARRAGAPTLAITAEADSLVTHVAETTILTNGQHDTMSVKTSSYVQALIALYVLAIGMGERGASNSEQGVKHPKDWIFQISKAGEIAAVFLDRQRKEIQRLAKQFSAAARVFVLGGGPNSGTAEEASLKVIEMAKMHSEAQELENFLHGRLREVDQTTPLFFIAPKGLSSARVLDFLTVTHHIKAPSVVLTDEVTEGIQQLATHIIQMPGELEELATPLLYIIPMHLFGYESALRRGYDPNARRYNIVPQKVRYGQPVE
jgi:glucosamine--fructose-6-phosphate aminotransferase (isomerizing)